jgi:hypothetical protein
MCLRSHGRSGVSERCLEFSLLIYRALGDNVLASPQQNRLPFAAVDCGLSTLPTWGDILRLDYPTDATLFASREQITPNTGQDYMTQLSYITRPVCVNALVSST